MIRMRFVRTCQVLLSIDNHRHNGPLMGHAGIVKIWELCEWCTHTQSGHAQNIGFHASDLGRVPRHKREYVLSV